MSLHTSDLVLVPGQQLPPLDHFRICRYVPDFSVFSGQLSFQAASTLRSSSTAPTSCENAFLPKKVRKNHLPSSHFPGIIGLDLSTL